jgi:hypothetical protein
MSPNFPVQPGTVPVQPGTDPAHQQQQLPPANQWPNQAPQFAQGLPPQAPAQQQFAQQAPPQMPPQQFGAPPPQQFAQQPQFPQQPPQPSFPQGGGPIAAGGFVSGGAGGASHTAVAITDLALLDPRLFNIGAQVDENASIADMPDPVQPGYYVCTPMAATQPKTTKFGDNEVPGTYKFGKTGELYGVLGVQLKVLAMIDPATKQPRATTDVDRKILTFVTTIVMRSGTSSAHDLLGAITGRKNHPGVVSAPQVIMEINKYLDKEAPVIVEVDWDLDAERGEGEDYKTFLKGKKMFTRDQSTGMYLVRNSYEEKVGDRLVPVNARTRENVRSFHHLSKLATITMR